ncbi:MAG: ABC transporter permease subunit [Halobacteriovoraceae bacterium]|nr:ABC transporter permease subunit [Halobacteriovoraceae bacterium]
MKSFIISKLSYLIPLLFGISIMAFGLIRLVPGDPVMLLIGERGASPEIYQEMKQKMGYDKSIFSQYFIFLKNVLKGELGESVISKRPVLEEFIERFPATLELGFLSLFMACLLGIPIGIICAVKRNSILDYFFMGSSLVGYSMPIFWWGLLLILFFSVTLGLTPVSGRISVLYEIESITGFFLIDSWFTDEPWETFISSVNHLILPAIAMGTIPLAVISRMTRSSMLEVLGEDYIRTAKSKGVPWRKIILIHALKNALIPIITVIGLLFSSIITGAILTETIFSWPGIGKWIVASITARDYPVIQGGILIIALLIICINLLVDFLYVLVNPKMRVQGKS